MYAHHASFVFDVPKNYKRDYKLSIFFSLCVMIQVTAMDTKRTHDQSWQYNTGAITLNLIHEQAKLYPTEWL